MKSDYLNKLIDQKKLMVSDIRPKKWFAVDTKSQLNNLRKLKIK